MDDLAGTTSLGWFPLFLENFECVEVRTGVAAGGWFLLYIYGK